MWARTWHQIFIRGEVIRKELTPFLAHGETGAMERNTEYIRYYRKQILHWISIFSTMVITLSCCIQTKVVMMWNFTCKRPQWISPRARYPTAPTINQNEWLRANCPLQIADICEKGEKIIFENWIIIKPMGHSAQAAHRQGEQQVKVHRRRLEQVLCKCCKKLKGPTLDILFLFFSRDCTAERPRMIYSSPQDRKFNALFAQCCKQQLPCFALPPRTPRMFSQQTLCVNSIFRLFYLLHLLTGRSWKETLVKWI